MNKKTAQTPKAMVRFQLFVTRDQYNFLKKIAQEEGISGGYAIRKGLALYAKQHGTALDVGPFIIR